ncbi:MAG TPA: cyclopropane-fatty-acyl-phospholipid synthase family protein [Longimicrobiales bacterium]|nr:cyclopropane-fatty-acyl-phospholipid synthase family protein [Longimicrobiales bacterium]
MERNGSVRAAAARSARAAHPSETATPERATAPAPARPPDPSPAATSRPSPAPGSKHLETSRAILADLFGPPETRAFGVRYWDEYEEAGATDSPPFTIVLAWPGALRQLMLPPTERNAAEAYVYGHVDIEGDVETAVATLAPAITGGFTPGRLAALLGKLLSLPSDRGGSGSSEPGRGRFRGRWRLAHSRARDRGAVRFHYDLGNEFFALWLDPRMVYSCAYFTSEADDLDTAQEAKLDLICRKLRLRPGERFLDIGCGWGGLILHAAERYGVDATGITLSERQAEGARRRIAEAGLGDRCRVEVMDYRDLPATARFDKVASVGMVEHVGEANLPAYYDAVLRVLEPGGLFLNHGIVTLEPAYGTMGRLKARLRRRLTSFIEHYVFPDAQLLGYVTVLAPAERAGFEVRDVESLREHYAMTLREWVRRLEANREEAVRLTSEETYRVWRLYMAGCAHQFASGKVGVVQSLLAAPDRDGRVRMPMTRLDLYSPPNA